MAINLRLREALMRAHLTPKTAAIALQVDPKTVERWISSGRTPYPCHRYAMAALLGVSESDLWPEAGTLKPLRFSFAGICIWCDRHGCTDTECILRHEAARWEICPLCGGAPWTRPGGTCGCLNGLIQAVATKFALSTVVA
ncbi:helix-turn-helix domain-containing protein [Nocardia sp. NPDC088792]|uniref:helix-turn-helix domain-containing protein n=1 Tax=Nocardia sp. NPDC088792 TaxID=3364332 RepID=UPI0037F43196